MYVHSRILLLAPDISTVASQLSLAVRNYANNKYSQNSQETFRRAFHKTNSDKFACVITMPIIQIQTNTFQIVCDKYNEQITHEPFT